MSFAWHAIQRVGSMPLTGAWQAAQLFDMEPCDRDSIPGLTDCCHAERRMEGPSARSILMKEAMPMAMAKRRSSAILMLGKPPYAELDAGDDV